jgi:hypothetical protein
MEYSQTLILTAQLLVEGAILVVLIRSKSRGSSDSEGGGQPPTQPFVHRAAYPKPAEKRSPVYIDDELAFHIERNNRKPNPPVI